MGTGLEIAAVAALAGGAMQAVGQIQGGNAAAKQGQFQKKQAEDAAIAANAVAQRKSIDTRRQANLVQSRLQAVSAAGGGATDPTVMNLAGQIAGEGEYRALTDLYNGESDAAAYTTRGNIAEYEGKSAKKASRIAAMSTILSSAGGLYGKYGSMGGTKTAGGFGNVPGTSGGSWSSSPYSGTDIDWNL